MKALFFLPLLLLAYPFGSNTSSTASGPAPLPSASAAPVRHCQVPCGIYGDRMRLDMMLEDAATIEKAMGEIGSLTDQPNQVVRWVLTKDQHAAHVQELVASYWLAQRIKAPEDPTFAPARAKYMGELEMMHQLTVAAMKCKQTTDVAHVAKIRELIELFDSVYFDDHDPDHKYEHLHNK